MLAGWVRGLVWGGGLEGCVWKDGRSERKDMAAIDIDVRIQLDIDIDIAMSPTSARMGCRN